MQENSKEALRLSGSTEEFTKEIQEVGIATGNA